MVKDSKKPAKAAGAEVKPRRAQKAFVSMGRPPGDPDDVRSERLVLRVHPDLLGSLNQFARESGITRSLFVEKILLMYVNEEGAGLDSIGRKLDSVFPQEPQRRARPDEKSTDWMHRRGQSEPLNRLRGLPPKR